VPLTLRLLAGACLLAGAAGTLGPTSADGQYDLAGTPAWQTVLPDELAEVSGLAFSPDGRLFAHGDELGVIYQLEPRTGRIVGRFGLASNGREPNLGKKRKGGTPADVVVGDFEDIAVVGDRFFLVTSNGVLLEFKEGDPGSRVRFTTHATGLGGLCELEGVAHDAPSGALLLLCKDRPGKGRMREVQAYAWSLADRRLAPAPRLSLPLAELSRITGTPGFNGSAIAANPDGKSFVLVAGPQRAFAEIGRAGRVLRGGVFPRGLQRQPEGAAFAPDGGSLLISSEAAGARATLAGYLPRTR
jgi:hypothetical protein